MRYSISNGLFCSLACLITVGALAPPPITRVHEALAAEEEQGRLKVIPWAHAGLPAFNVVAQESGEQAQWVEASKETIQIALMPGRYILYLETPVLTPVPDV